MSLVGEGKLQIERDGRALVFAAGQQLAFDEPEVGEVVVFALAREHVEVEQAQRLAGLGVGDGVELQVANPFVGRLDPLELQAEDGLVDAEHAVQHALVGEIDAQLLGIHGVFLLLQLVAVVAPVPDVDLRVGVAGLLDLELAELGQFGVELGLQARLELLQEVDRRGGVA